MIVRCLLKLQQTIKEDLFLINCAKKLLIYSKKINLKIKGQTEFCKKKIIIIKP